MSEEPEILKFVRDGKASFNDVHRTCQEKIMDDIYRQGIRADDNTVLTIDEVLDTAELKQWSKYMALRLIFESVSNSVDDIFMVKSAKYRSEESGARERTLNQLNLDFNKDGQSSTSEITAFRSAELVRR